MTPNENKRYRHEYKYLISTAQAESIRMKLAGLMRPDPYAPEGYYHISSLYFDTPGRACLRENEEGEDPREKIRLRIYNHDPDRILSLECKRKQNGMTLKTACRLSREQADSLIAGRPLSGIASMPEVLRKLTLRMLRDGMKPAVIVDYDRFPYVCPAGNTRVTLDTHVAASAHVASFLCEEYPQRPILPAGMHLLEVKWDEYLPDVIYRALQSEAPERTRFSKYALCASALTTR